MASPDDDLGFHVLKEPADCILWREPGRINGPTRLFDCLETFEDDSHLKRLLLKCRECGQLYFYEFYEWIDWEEGDDPQYWTYIPVETAAEIEMLKEASPFDLMRFTPRLQRDFPNRGKAPRLIWIR